ncbi:hypothetical protein LZZ85_01045 [Terrimonas sp. NA20]|uniref:Uncharacterized protein n=1 Tax=Terrimonas ginsenosidimutans TaxID=2908004 RepID=A0ABS9KKJ0_9BACT|nr:hypothetical protein [Terrimonas ginsenosidimutans]MCG2612836.1 hypothetical protein [Terrimonas ginsenosidimutans]
MNPTEFQQLVERSVLQYPQNDHLQEERIIELADLVHFVHNFRPSLRINQDQPLGFNIVEEQEDRIGVILREKRLSGDQDLFTSDEDLATLKRNEDLKSIWLVLVSSSLHTNNRSAEGLPSDLPDTYFDHIFSFDFFTQTVCQFK